MTRWSANPEQRRDWLRLARTENVGPVTFDDHRQNAVPLITKLVVQDGKWVVWEDSEYAKGKRKLVKP